MERLFIGASDPGVELLQSTLKKAGYYSQPVSGVYDQATQEAVQAFQSNNGLIPDGMVGHSTWNALMPYLYGYDTYSVREGDTLYQIAKDYGVTLADILAANPEIDIYHLRRGQKVIVPVGTIVPTDVSYTYDLMQMNLHGFKMRYPFLEIGDIGRTALFREIPYLILGKGEKQVFYCASYHANEWITTPVLMKFIEQFSEAYVNDSTIYGCSAREIYDQVSIYLVPMVNPDGVDLVTGALGPQTAAYQQAKQIAGNYAEIPFPEGWKASIEGIDLNLQYPAGWEQAKENKYLLGFTTPAPRDFVGNAPLVASEARAVYDFTLEHDFKLMLTYHSQGEVIYWKYLDYLPEKSYEIGRQFSEASGYELEETPYASSFAGYKDWYIQEYNRPGYTIEVGMGTSPLPITQFDTIYQDNIGILVLGAVLI